MEKPATAEPVSYLQGLDRQSGTMLWNETIPFPVTRSPCCRPKRILVQGAAFTKENWLLAYDVQGKLKWARGEGVRSRRGRFPPSGFAKFYPGDHRQLAGIALLDRQTGERLWFSIHDKTIEGDPHLGKVRCILGTRPAGSADPGTRFARARLEMRRRPGRLRLVVHGKDLVYVNSAGEIGVGRNEDRHREGQTRTAFAKASRRFLSRNQALVATQYGLATVSSKTERGGPRTKKELPATLVRRRLEPIGPMVLSRVGIYVPTAKTRPGVHWHGEGINEPRPVGGVHYFADPLPEAWMPKMGARRQRASLKDMTLAGLQVPPGFTIRTDVRNLFRTGRALA